MEELKRIVGDNLIRLRREAGMTQAQLGEKLNYSDKTISKWERGDSLPDAYVLKQIASLFHITVDVLLRPYDEGTWKEEKKSKFAQTYNSTAILLLSIIVVWTLAFIIFEVLWFNGLVIPDVFVMAIPVSLVIMLVMRTVWNGGRHNFWVISALIASVLIAVYFFTRVHNPWQIFLLIIPGEIILYLCFHIRRR